MQNPGTFLLCVDRPIRAPGGRGISSHSARLTLIAYVPSTNPALRSRSEDLRLAWLAVPPQRLFAEPIEVVLVAFQRSDMAAFCAP